MAVEVWGNLPKAQDNPQTIEEAINAAILAHEADPESHLGVGESLQSHREDSTLDHPAGSALSDKLTMTELTFGDNFPNLSLYSITGDVSNTNWPGASLYVEWGATNISKIYSPLISPSFHLGNDEDFLFQINAQWLGSDITPLDIDMGLGIEDGDSSAGLGFTIHNGVVKGILAVGGNAVLTSDLGIDITVAHIYRAQFIAGDAFAYFFVDGVQVGSLARPSGDFNDDGNLTIKAKLTGSNDGNLLVNNVFCASSLPII